MFHGPPDVKVRADRGTPYPSCTQAEIDILQDRHLKPARQRLVTRHEATEQIEAAHAEETLLDDAQKAAARRLNNLQQSNRHGPDVIFKIFNDLDVLLFCGKLRGNIYLRWNHTDRKLNGGKILAWTAHPGSVGKRVSIEMSTTLSTLSVVGLRDILSTLVHEMVHAYLDVVTGNDQGFSDLVSGGHGSKFRRCCVAVQRRLGYGFKDIQVSPGYGFRDPDDPLYSGGFRWTERGERDRVL